MKSGKLKAYRSYRRRICNFAKAMNIKMIFDADDTSWLPFLKEIKVEEDLDNTVEVARTLHELGHAIDDLWHLRPVRRDSITMRAYAAVYAGEANKTQASRVMGYERRAWRYAEGLAKRLGIRLGVWFYKEKKACLATYRAR